MNLLSVAALIGVLWSRSCRAFAAPFRPSPLSLTRDRGVEHLLSREGKHCTSSRSTSTCLYHHRVKNKVLWLAATTLRGGVSDDVLAAEAFDWCSNLGAPAALVAGAVLATLSSTRNELTPRESDKQGVQFRKKTCRFLLLTAFALEVFCIFVVTVTGTMLLAHGDIPAGVHGGIHYHSPMGFMAYNHEFEYLTSRVTFLQGLFNWLAAVAMQFTIRQPEESEAAHRMNLHISAWLITMILVIVQFYNDHITFYRNYLVMLWRYVAVAFRRYVWQWPIRPMTLLTVPSAAVSFALGWKAFEAPPGVSEIEEKELLQENGKHKRSDR